MEIFLSIISRESKDPAVVLLQLSSSLCAASIYVQIKEESHTAFLQLSE